MATNTMAPGYRAPIRHQVRGAFDDVGAGTWCCSRCHTGATYANPLVLVKAPAGSPYSHVFIHREGCVA